MNQKPETDPGRLLRLGGPLVIVLIALAVRLWFVTEERPPELYLLGDMTLLEERARAMLAGSERATHTFTPVGYPALLALVFAAGGGYPAIAQLQALLGALTCLLVYRLTLALSGRRAVAAVAALALALYPPLVFYTGLLLTETLAAFLITAFAWLALPGQRPWASPLAGLALGAAIATRPNLALALPLLVGVAWGWRAGGPHPPAPSEAQWRGGGEEEGDRAGGGSHAREGNRAEGEGSEGIVGKTRRMVVRWWLQRATWSRRLVVSLGVAVLTLVPVVAHNSGLTGRVTGVATNGGINFFLAHCRCKAVQMPPGGRVLQVSANVNRRYFSEVVRVEHPAHDEGAFYRRAMAQIASEPGRLLAGGRNLAEGLGLGRMGPFPEQAYWPGWSGHDALLNVPGRAIFWVGILPLVAWGVWRGRRMEPGQALLLAVLASLVPAFALFIGDPRVRVSLDPLVLALAADAWWQGVARIRGAVVGRPRGEALTPADG